MAVRAESPIDRARSPVEAVEAYFFSMENNKLEEDLNADAFTPDARATGGFMAATVKNFLRRVDYDDSPEEFLARMQALFQGAVVEDAELRLTKVEGLNIEGVFKMTLTRGDEQNKLMAKFTFVFEGDNAPFKFSKIEMNVGPDYTGLVELHNRWVREAAAMDAATA